MILSGQTIRKLSGMIEPFHERSVAHGMTFGLGPAGYDVRIAEDVTILPGEFVLASTIERFVMPPNVVGRVCDKSTLIRAALTSGNTVIEPGWSGYLTLELTNERKPYYITPMDILALIEPETAAARRKLASRLTHHIEMYNNALSISLKAGQPIAQILFEFTDAPVEKPYDGRYQNQERGPQKARYFEREDNV